MIGYKFEPLREPWSMMRGAFLWVSISFVRPEPNEMRILYKVIGEGHEPSARGPTAGTLENDEGAFLGKCEFGWNTVLSKLGVTSVKKSQQSWKEKFAQTWGDEREKISTKLKKGFFDCKQSRQV